MSKTPAVQQTLTATQRAALYLTGLADEEEKHLAALRVQLDIAREYGRTEMQEDMTAQIEVFEIVELGFREGAAALRKLEEKDDKLEVGVQKPAKKRD